MKKIFSIFLRIGISIILLTFLFRQVDTKSLFEMIRHSHKLYLLLSFLIMSGMYIFCIFRWHMLLKGAGIDLALKRVLISSAGGAFFSLFLPSTIGGDLMRSIDLAAHTKKTKEVVATVLLDRLSGYVALVIVAILAIGFGWRFIQDSSVIFAVVILALALLAILAVFFNKFIYAKINKFFGSSSAGKIRETIKGLHQEIHVFRHKKWLIVNNLLLSFIVQLIAPTCAYLIALAIGIKISFMYFLVFLPIIGAITMLPISIGGLGVRDAAMIYFFAKAGVAKDAAFAMSLINFGMVIIYGALGGLIYVLTVRHRRLQHHQPSPV